MHLFSGAGEGHEPPHTVLAGGRPPTRRGAGRRRQHHSSSWHPRDVEEERRAACRALLPRRDASKRRKDCRINVSNPLKRPTDCAEDPVCLEGIDNAGKTAVARSVVRRLRSTGHSAQVSKEFSTSVGRVLRTSYLSASAELKTLLFAADRIERQQRIIEPALRSGATVIADRWTFSALAYRLAGATPARRKQLMSYINDVNRVCLVPDLVLYLDIPVSLSVRRRQINDPMPTAKIFCASQSWRPERLFGPDRQCSSTTSETSWMPLRAAFLPRSATA